MKILHPENDNKYVPLKELGNHLKKGYYSIIDKKDEGKLNYFLHSFNDYCRKKGIRIIDKELLDDLPFSINTDTWKERRKDLKIVNHYINDRKNLSVLDIGSWNGWLSNYLSKKGHYVVATNIFSDEVNGLEANKNYETSFISLQLLPEDIFRISHLFDIIIFNRNWPYIRNYRKAYESAKKLLKEDGTIIFTGLPFYKDSKVIEKQIKILDNGFRNEYGISVFYQPTKGYLNFNDFEWLKENNIILKPYNNLKNCLLLLFPKKLKLFYGIFKK